MTAVSRTTVPADHQSVADHLAECAAALKQQRVFRTEQLTTLAAEASASSPTAQDGPQDEVRDTLRAAALNALAAIQAAIERIEAGTYGLCAGCGAAISLERLEILPMAAVCMPCAHAREQHAR